jgi:cytochrome c5
VPAGEQQKLLFNRSGGLMKVSIIFVVVAALLLPAAAFSQDMTGEQVYQKTCAVCHTSGVAGAPKLGDKPAWAHRIGEGMDIMYKSALQGDGAMPAKGGNSALSDAEVKAAVDYMIGKSK